MHVAITVLDTSVEPPIISAQDQDLRARLQRTIKTWPHESTLYIATNSLRTKLRNRLMGTDGRTGNQSLGAAGVGRLLIRSKKRPPVFTANFGATKG